MAELTDAVERAIASMPWVTDADQAAIQLARTYARQIEIGIAEGGQDATKALYLGPHLLKTLDQLGGTPAGRGALDIKEETRGKLANLRAVRGSA